MLLCNETKRKSTGFLRHHRLVSRRDCAVVVSVAAGCRPGCCITRFDLAGSFFDDNPFDNLREREKKTHISKSLVCEMKPPRFSYFLRKGCWPEGGGCRVSNILIYICSTFSQSRVCVEEGGGQSQNVPVSVSYSPRCDTDVFFLPPPYPFPSGSSPWVSSTCTNTQSFSVSPLKAAAAAHPSGERDPFGAFLSPLKQSQKGDVHL